MTDFPVYTMESAPERSRPALQQLQSAFGMIPNLVGAMATSPVLINSLVGLFGNVHGGSFTEAQVQIVLLTDAVTVGRGVPYGSGSQGRCRPGGCPGYP
jgi:hypothetical protein